MNIQLLKRLFFSHEVSWHPCQTSNDHKYKHLIPNYKFCSIDLYVCPYASIRLSWLLYLCSKFWNQEIWDSNSHLPFWDSFDNLWPIIYAYKFQDWLVNFCTHTHKSDLLLKDFDRDCIQSADQCRGHSHLNNIKFFDLWQWGIFPLTWVFFNFCWQCVVVFRIQMLYFFVKCISVLFDTILNGTVF